MNGRPEVAGALRAQNVKWMAQQLRQAMKMYPLGLGYIEHSDEAYEAAATALLAFDAAARSPDFAGREGSGLTVGEVIWVGPMTVVDVWSVEGDRGLTQFMVEYPGAFKGMYQLPLSLVKSQALGVGVEEEDVPF